jgi:hypothetical protein
VRYGGTAMTRELLDDPLCFCLQPSPKLPVPTPTPPLHQFCSAGSYSATIAAYISARGKEALGAWEEELGAREVDTGAR